MIELRPEFRFSSQIRPILPGLRPFCLDLANFGRIWTILLGFGPYSFDLGPKGDGAEGGLGGGTDVWTYGRTDGQIPPVFYRTLSPSGPLPKKEGHFLHTVFRKDSESAVRFTKFLFFLYISLFLTNVLSFVEL